jgi:hypothetical protein
MQRPEAPGTKAALTDRNMPRSSRAMNSRATGQGAVGPFRNDGAWLDKTFRQTSLIVEPANGRTPPLTPAAEPLPALAPRGTSTKQEPSRSTGQPIPEGPAQN